MHRQFKLDETLSPLTCPGCGRTPHGYTCPTGVFIECSPCGRRTDITATETDANWRWLNSDVVAIPRAA